MMDKDKILTAARERMQTAVDADQDNRNEALDDMRNIAGEQWEAGVREEREREGRPCITLNRLPQFVRQITGDIRKLNPAIKVTPGDNRATKETAEVIEGLVRQIEYASDAATVYEGAAESAAQCGMGAFRVLTDYESDESFDQCIKVKRIHNPFAVYWDPEAVEATREDAKYVFITSQMSEADFKKAYPKAKAMQDFPHDGENEGLAHWRSGADVVVAEYYWLEETEVTLGLTQTGEVVENPKAPVNVVKTRKAKRHVPHWAKLSYGDVLEGPTKIAGKHIPVIAVMGEEVHLGDEVVRVSAIRYAKAPQRLYNYWNSTSVEHAALQPKAPYIVTAKQIEGYDDIWRQANTKNYPFLPYKPDEKAPGVPQRAIPPQPSSAITQEILRAADDMKATTGIYDAALGAQSNEKSGVAIRQRQIEADVSTSIYTDNLAKSIAHCGRIIIGMIPEVYDTRRVVRILGEEGAESLVTVNDKSMQITMGGVQTVDVNPLNVGQYAVRVSVGPNYTTRRQEAAEGIMSFVQAVPAAGQIAGDLIARAMDWPDAEKLAKRLEKALPPGLIGPEEMDGEEAAAAQQGQAMQQQMAMQAQQIEAARAQAEIREAEAKATKAEADAAKAAAEAEAADLNLQALRLQMAGGFLPPGAVQPA